jgi:hypothetical protein
MRYFVVEQRANLHFPAVRLAIRSGYGHRSTSHDAAQLSGKSFFLKTRCCLYLSLGQKII